MTLTTSNPLNSSTALNNTNDTNCLNQTERTWMNNVMPVNILVISVLGIILNAFILMVFCLHKKSCTVAEIYLSNLAAADLILMSFLPFWAINKYNNYNWTFGLFLCKVVHLSIHINAYCSIYFLVLVSLDRYVAVVHSMSYGRMRRPKYAKLFCLLVWGFGLFLSIPTLIYRKTRPDCNKTICIYEYSRTTHLVFQGILTFAGFVIPIPIISFCAFKIVKVLRNRESIPSQNHENKASSLVLAVLLAFLICWLPFHLTRNVQAIIGVHSTNQELKSILKTCTIIFVFLAFFNSVLNPILYVIVGKNFRKKVFELFKQRNNRITLNGTIRSTLMASIKSRI